MAPRVPKANANGNEAQLPPVHVLPALEAGLPIVAVPLPGNQQLAAAVQQAANPVTNVENDKSSYYAASLAHVWEENQRLQLKLAEQDSLASQAAQEMSNYRAELINTQQRLARSQASSE